MKGLSIQAKLYIWTVILCGSVLLGWNLAQTDWSTLWAILLLGTVASISLIFKVEGTTASSHYNISFFIYAFTFMLLGLPAAILVVLISNVVEWVWHKYPWYIQCFNLGMYFITFQTTSLVHTVITTSQSPFSAASIIALITAMITFTLVNHLLVGMVVWLARGERLTKSGIFDLLPLTIDFTLLALGATGALLWMVSPVALVLIVLPIYLIYSTLKVPALERKTETDPKTGLFNDQYFQRIFQAELERANRFERPLTVVMADMDLLRNINNTYGHLAGDAVLIGVAKILKESFRDVDTVARFGGEEFAILMPECTPEEIYPHVEEVRCKIQNTDFLVETSITPIHVTLSFGIAERGDEQPGAKELIHNADSALYHAKLNGRNRATIYSSEGYEGLFNQPVSQIDALKIPMDAPRSVMVEKAPGGMPLPAAVSPVSTVKELPQGEATRTSTRREWLLQLYISLLVLTCFALFFIINKPTLDHLDWMGLAVLAGMLALTEWFSVDIYYRDTSVSTSAAPLLAGMLLFGPVGLLVMSLTFALVAKLKHNSKWSRVIFNASNQLFAGLLCNSLIHLTGRSYLDWEIWAQFMLALVSAAIFYITTTSAVALAMVLDAGLPFKSTWKEKFSWLLPYYLVLGLVAQLMTLAFQTAGVLGTGVVIIPLLLMRYSQKQYIDRTRGMVAELKEKNATLEKNAQEINQLSDGLLKSLAQVIDLRDPYVLGHSQQVTQYSVLIATRLGLSAEKIELVRKASLLHDIGKLGIPDKILRKPGPLTKDEFRIIQNHSVLGAEFLASSQALVPLTPVVRHHHERYDGGGYPDGLVGEMIPVEARIVAVADAVEAMASDRPYRKALDYESIVAEIEQGMGTQFDPEAARVMLGILKEQGGPFLVNSAEYTDPRHLLGQFGELIPDYAKPKLAEASD